MKLPFKRVKEIIAEEVDSLSVIEEGVWSFEISQAKGTSGAERHVKASTADIEFEWGRKDRDSKYGMDPYLRWAPTGKGGKFSTLGELQWPGDPFTYEKIEGSSKSNPKVRVVTGPSSRKGALGKITTIKSQPRIDAWWEPEDVIQFEEIPIIANLQDKDESPSTKRITRPEKEEETVDQWPTSDEVRIKWVELSKSTKTLIAALGDLKALPHAYNFDASTGIDHDLRNLSSAVWGPSAAGGLDLGQGLIDASNENTARALDNVNANAVRLANMVGGGLKKYYISGPGDLFSGFLMSDAVENLSFNVITKLNAFLVILCMHIRNVGSGVNICRPDLQSWLANIWGSDSPYYGPAEVNSEVIESSWWRHPYYATRGRGEEVQEEVEVEEEPGILDRLSTWWNEEDEAEEEEDTGEYQESFKISSQRLSQLIKEELQLIVEAQDPQGQGDGEEYLGVAAPAIKADKTKRLRTMRASIAALTSKINQECGASGDSSSCDSDKDQLSDLQAQEQELAQN